jgi:glycolate oxidase iron-sulfur subunit
VASSQAWPRPDEAPALEDVAKCVHCGLCLNSCPTYVITGLETESPRGRIFFARAIEEGEIPLTPAVQQHWELCLQCRACEAVCPSGVPYGRIMEHARAQLDAAPPANGRSRRLRRFFLRQVIARPRVLPFAIAPARWFARSWLRPIARRLLLRRAGMLARGEAQLPRRPGAPFRPGAVLPHVEGASQEAVVFTGCVMSELFGHVHRATVQVLAGRGVQPIVPRGQLCCGALHAHDGDIDYARKLARKNIEALEPTGDAVVVVNSAGCGAAMKEYGDLLKDDAHFAERARRLSARIRDATEFVASLESRPAGSFPARVTYQDPCHLAHAQRIREQPRELLGALSGCELVETPGADMCCGAAGLYSLVQPEMSAELRARKSEQFRSARPDVVATANPGCQMQYEAAVREAGIDARVMHVMEILAEAESPPAKQA